MSKGSWTNLVPAIGQIRTYQRGWLSKDIAAGLVITGLLEKGMEESAQAAMSYIRSRSGALSLDSEFYQKIDVHVHFPDFVRKDGPSAGVTMATSIASALTRHPIRSEVAMTGEITLRGRVLPIGGVKEKVLGAHRAGIRLGIATTTAPDNVAALLEVGLGPHWAELFGAVGCGDMVPNKKPAPDVYLAAARAWAARPGGCVGIEDSAQGAKAGLAAGMRVLGFAAQGADTATARSLAALGVPLFHRMEDLPGVLGF